MSALLRTLAPRVVIGASKAPLQTGYPDKKQDAGGTAQRRNANVTPAEVSSLATRRNLHRGARHLQYLHLCLAHYRASKMVLRDFKGPSVGKGVHVAVMKCED